MDKVEGKIIGYIKTVYSYESYTDIFINYIVKYYNDSIKKDNYVLSDNISMSRAPLTTLVTGSVLVSFNKKGKAMVQGIQFDQDNQNPIELKEYTKSEYYKLVVDNNPLTQKEREEIYKIDKRNRKIPLIPALVFLLVPIGILIMNYESVSNPLLWIFCSILILGGIILVYKSLKKETAKLSNKPEKIIRLEVVDRLEELTSNAIILKEMKEKNAKYYVYATNSNSFKTGDIYSININKYKRPFIDIQVYIKQYTCSELRGFVDSDFLK